MGISDSIADFISSVLECENGCAELRRAELAQRFHCVPSQINYVISTRFSPEHGYVVESRRGGNGYIRIRRVRVEYRILVADAVKAAGNHIDTATARAYLSNLLEAGAIDSKTARLMAAAMEESALQCLPEEYRSKVRAGVFRQMLMHAAY